MKTEVYDKIEQLSKLLEKTPNTQKWSSETAKQYKVDFLNAKKSLDHSIMMMSKYYRD